MSASPFDTSKRLAVVATFDTEGSCTNWKGWRQVFERFDEWKHWDAKTYYHNMGVIEQGILDFKPEVLFLLVPRGYEAIDLQKIKRLCNDPLIIYFYGDYTHKILHHKNTEFIDFMFLSNENQVEKYRKIYRIDQVHFLPTACYQLKEFPEDRESQLFEKIVFVGDVPRHHLSIRKETHHWQRGLFWEQMKKNHGNRLIQINEPHYPQRNRIYDRLPAIYSSADYSLAMNGYWPEMRKYSSNRTWAILCLGGVLLTQVFDGLKHFGLNDGENCIVFDGPREMADKVEHYDNNVDAREAIRKKGFEFGNTCHTGYDRYERMKKIIEREVVLK